MTSSYLFAWDRRTGATFLLFAFRGTLPSPNNFTWACRDDFCRCYSILLPLQDEIKKLVEGVSTMRWQAEMDQRIQEQAAAKLDLNWSAVSGAAAREALAKRLLPELENIKASSWSKAEISSVALAMSRPQMRETPMVLHLIASLMGAAKQRLRPGFYPVRFWKAAAIEGISLREVCPIGIERLGEAIGVDPDTIKSWRRRHDYKKQRAWWRVTGRDGLGEVGLRTSSVISLPQ
jgi:hypothetical protein